MDDLKKCDFLCIFSLAEYPENCCENCDCCPIWDQRYFECNLCANEECPHWECE